jgi:hypothetical protein
MTLPWLAGTESLQDKDEQDKQDEQDEQDKGLNRGGATAATIARAWTEASVLITIHTLILFILEIV